MNRPHPYFNRSFSKYAFAALLIIFGFKGGDLTAQEAAAPVAEKPLIDFSSPDAARQVTPAKGVPAGSTVSVDKDGILANFTAWQKGDSDHPAFHITPATGTSWDLSSYGHVEAKITNTSDTDIKIHLHVVPTGEGFWTEKNQEGLDIQPGKSETLKVIFGYSKGFKPAAPLNSASIAEIFIFLYHSTQPHSFRVEELKAAGTAGEKPVVDAPPAAK